MASGDEYVERAKDRILELLREHHSMVHPEVMSRISEGYYVGSTNNIDPHHITTALRELHAEGEVRTQTAVTRGEHHVATLRLTTPPPRTQTAIARASARKRLLLDRYTGWSQGTGKHPHGIIGPAGETAVRTALHAAAAMQPAAPNFGPVARILGTRLPGPADSGGYLVPLDRGGLPTRTVTVLVEVKNIGSWIYPSSAELVQPLNKCLLLKRAQHDEPVLGILTCRRAHPHHLLDGSPARDFSS